MYTLIVKYYLIKTSILFLSLVLYHTIWIYITLKDKAFNRNVRKERNADNQQSFPHIHEK